MSTFRNESMILDVFRLTKNSEIRTVGNWFKCRKIFYSLKYNVFYKYWKNTSGKSELPPDFYNEKLKLMMEVMRIDDCGYVDNKGKIQNLSLQKEGKIYKKFFKEIDRDDLSIFINTNPIPSTPKENCSMKKYYDNFRRIFNDHNSKIISCFLECTMIYCYYPDLRSLPNMRQGILK